MTLTPPARGSRMERLLDGGWSTGLFVIGCLWDMLCILNVPGAARLHWGADASTELTDLGVVLFLVVLAAWATVFVRARRPVVVLIAGAVLLVIGLSYLLALVGAFHAMRHWVRWQGWIAAATTLAVILFAAREAMTPWGGALAWMFDNQTSDPEGIGWALAPWVIAVVALAGLGGLMAYQRTRADAELSRRRADHAVARADALGEELARQAERERIARDLHDGLGHRLSTAALSASAFEAQVAAAPGVDPTLAQWARTVRQQTHAALEDVRGVVGGLRAESAEEVVAASPGLRGLGTLLADLRSAGHRIDAYVVVDGAEGIGPALGTTAYRIAQEALTNAIKHAPGGAISFTLDAAPDRGVRIRVENPLMTSPAPPSSGFGLKGMRERVESVGGQIWVGPHAGRFIVDVSLPRS